MGTERWELIEVSDKTMKRFPAFVQLLCDAASCVTLLTRKSVVGFFLGPFGPVLWGCHSRCYGFATWDAAGYGSGFKYQEEAEERHAECKAIVQHMRRLLGARLFSVFRTNTW